MPGFKVKPLAEVEYDQEKKMVTEKSLKSENESDISNRNASNATNSTVSFRLRWESFRNETTLHGIQHIDFKRKIRGIIWTLALAAMVATLLKVLVDLHKAYFSYPTITNVNVEMAEELSFPAVTVCNLSPFNKSVLNPNAALLNYYLKLSNLGMFIPSINFSDPTYANLLEQKTKGYAENNSFDLSMFFICVFKQTWIECDQFFRPRMTEWGLCYSFNDNRQVPTITTEHTGSVTALTLYIKIDQTNYMYGENLGAGIKIVLHEHDEEPNVRDKGFLASPGFATYASLHMAKYKYLEAPFKAFGGKYCTNTKSSTFKNPLNYYSSYSYSACMKECKQIYVFERCNCSSVFDKGNGIADEGFIPETCVSGDSPVCSEKDYMECYKPNSDYFDTDTNGQTNCSCPLPCENIEYITQISTAYFPSDINTAVLQTYNFTDLRKDYLEVRIYYDSLKFTTNEQAAKYTTDDIAATLGGQMGIFIGASLLTLTEIVEFVIVTMLSFIRNRFFDKKQ